MDLLLSVHRYLYSRGDWGTYGFYFSPFVMFGLYMLAKQSFDTPKILIYRYIENNKKGGGCDCVGYGGINSFA